jgi:hypothetical protein
MSRQNIIGAKIRLARGVGGRLNENFRPECDTPLTGTPTGSHQAGEFFVDGNGDLFFCKRGGTPGSWFSVLLGA